MEHRRFHIGSGRSRPPHKARQVKCANCGASLSIHDERAVSLVCHYCGSRLSLSEAEQRVICRANQDVKPDFSFSIGDSYRYRGARFEVVARLAYIEDGDMSGMTLEYLLYHPCRGSMWLDEYKGEFSISWTTHIMPKDISVVELSRGDTMVTGDGRKWVFEEAGEYELVYVDGALPWVASTGDRIIYRAFSEKSGAGGVYEIQRIRNENEYSIGKRLDINTVRKASGKRDLGRDKGASDSVKRAVHDSQDAAVTRKSYIHTMIILFVLMILDGVLCFYCMQAGVVVLRQKITASELTKGVYTRQFPLIGNDSAVRVDIKALLNNAWMYVETRIVRQGDLLVHECESNIEYYSGNDLDGSWVEGSQDSNFMVRVPEGGMYRLFLQGVSAYGNTSDSSVAHHDIIVTVTDGAMPWGLFLASAILCLVLFSITVILYLNWKEQQ